MKRAILYTSLVAAIAITAACSFASGTSPEPTVGKAEGTPSAVSSPEPSPTPSPPLPATAAATPAASVTQAPVPTLTATATALPSPTLAATATPVPSPSPTLTLAATATPMPEPTVIATPTPCGVLPEGNFLTIWQADPALQAALGCPTSYHPRITPAAWKVQTSYQPFEHGEMIWSDHIGWYGQRVVFVLFPAGTYSMINDTFDPAVDPVSGGETPPSGLFEPLYGFGKVWRTELGVRESLGWARAAETPGAGRFQMLAHGYMVWISQTNQTYAFFTNTGTYRIYPVPFQ